MFWTDGKKTLETTNKASNGASIIDLKFFKIILFLVYIFNIIFYGIYFQNYTFSLNKRTLYPKFKP